MNPDTNTPDTHVELVLLVNGREVASAAQKEGAPSFRGSPVIPENAKDLARVLLSGHPAERSRPPV